MESHPPFEDTHPAGPYRSVPVEDNDGPSWHELTPLAVTGVVTLGLALFAWLLHVLNA